MKMLVELKSSPNKYQVVIFNKLNDQKESLISVGGWFEPTKLTEQHTHRLKRNQEKIILSWLNNYKL